MYKFYLYKKRRGIRAQLCSLFTACFLLLSAASNAQLTYCATHNDGGNGSLIDQVQFGGATHNTASTPAPAPDQYAYYPAVTIPVVMGTVENLTISTDPPGSYSGAIVSVWIDWNQDGTLDATEWTQVGTNIVNGSPATVPITIPLTATPGLTRMRIRSRGNGNQNGAGDACLSMGSGETEDYDITVVPATPCSGTPNAGTAIVNTNPACPNQSYTVSLSGSTVASGLVYDWQESPVGLNSWTSVGSAFSFTQMMTIGGDMDYRCVVSCGSLYDTSTIVTVNANLFYNCYCSPLNGTTLSSSYRDNFITGVEIANTTLNNPTSIYNANGYSQFSPATANYTATLYPGISYVINVEMMYPQYDYAGVWIDWDADGLMDNSTEYIATTGTATGATGIFTVPSSVAPGLTGLRVRVNDWGSFYGGTNLGSCSDDGAGETEDYVVTLGTLSNCSGTPTAVTVAGPAGNAICPNVDFTMVASNMTIGLGVTYDWQSNDGSGWISTGGSGTSYTVTGGITVPTSYRMITHCASSNLYDTSNVLAIAVNSFYACYCSPLNGTDLAGNYGDNFITSVDIPTTTLNNPTTSYNSNGYSQFIPSTASTTATLYPGITYTLNVGKMYQYNDAGAWIDWDGDGFLDNNTEFIALTTNPTGSSGTFTVPLTAVAGATGLRVRVNDNGYIYGGTNQGPCDDDGWGETEDYMVTIAALVNCTGQPAHSTIASTSGTSICPNIDFTLNATNMTVGIGISYDWQSNDGSGWITTGVTTTNYTVMGGISTSTSYRMITYCALSNMYDTSNVLAMTLNNFYQCYCSPSNGTVLNSYPWGYYGDNFITSVDIATTTLNNPTTATNPDGYELFDHTISSNTATLWPGVTYTINVGYLYPNPYEEGGVWIDWDGDGAMNNNTGTDEFIALTHTAAGASGTFTVPLTATSGMTGLRVRVNDYGYVYGVNNQGPCDDDEYGETEDYVVTIATLTNCSGKPAATTIVSSTGTGVCSGIDFMLTATNMTVGLGVAYDWQSNDGSGWITTGGTGTTLAVTGGITVATSYRMITHCSFSNQYDTSNVLNIGINPFYACYCSPLNGTDLASSNADNYVTSVVVPSTTLNNPTSSYNQNGYIQFFPSTTNTTGDLLQGVTYTINVDMLYPQYDEAGVWIDWDGDGTFNNNTGTDEFVTMTSTPSGATGSFLVPLSANLGTTGLRVRVNDNGYIYGPNDQGPCDDDYYGETEDYVITVLPAPSCLPPSAVSSGNITATSADVSFTSGATLYQIEYAPGNGFAIGTGTRVTTTSNPAAISPLSPSTQYSYYVRAICGANDTSVWSAGTPFYTLCAPVTAYPWNYDVESQPGNTGSGQFIGCWTASPTPNGSGYEWNVSTNGGTPSSGTGPTSAHSGNRYFYTEASNGPWNGSKTTLTSPQFDITGLSTPTLEFYYHMFGTDIVKLVIEVYNGASWDRVDSLVGQQQTSETAPWLLRSISLAAYTGNIQVRFEGTEGTSFEGDISIDDVVITATPTAVKLAKLNAANVGASNRVDWSTFSEERTDKFELQRSADGKNFQTIYEKRANGEPSRYTYMDNDPVKGMNYYRLHMTEANGNVTFSETVTAFVKSSGFDVQAFPNPVSQELTVKVTGVQGADAAVQVTDVTGKVIRTVKMNGSVEQIDMSGLANGIYLIKYSDASHAQIIKVNKQ